MIDYKLVGGRIAKRRRELGLKQYQVCEMIDVNDKYLSNIETGRSAPSLELIMNLCNILSATPDYFLMGSEPDRPINRKISDKLVKLDPKNELLLDGIIDLLIEQQETR